MRRGLGEWIRIGLNKLINDAEMIWTLVFVIVFGSIF